MIKISGPLAKLSLAVLVFLYFVSPNGIYGAVPIPSVTGPLEVTDDSYPFGAAAKTAVPQDLSKFGYVEEEFLVSGKANVYDFDSQGKVVVRTPDASYTTRILVRRPSATRKFSGNVIVELLNPTVLHDLDLQWAFCRDYFIEHGDIWVGITIKPIAAKALKKFNPGRYAAVSWLNPVPLDKTCPNPVSSLPDTVPETENGLAWDIVSQVGALVRSNEKKNLLKGYRVEYVYATGYSQTGGYLTTYINFIRPLPTAILQNGKPVYDGYLIGDGEGFAPGLNQCAQEFPASVSHLIIKPRREPVISVVTEGLLSTTINARRPDSDTADDRYRRYEVPGASHANRNLLDGFPCSEDTAKAGVPPIAANCVGVDKYGVTDFHFEYLMDAAFANLDAWVRANISPPRAQVIETIPGKNNPDPEIKRDEHGNAIGGLRTPYLDVPVAVYYSESKPADKESTFRCKLRGYKIPFDKEKIKELYPTRESYLSKVNGMVKSMVKGRFLTRTDGERVKREAEKVSAW